MTGGLLRLRADVTVLLRLCGWREELDGRVLDNRSDNPADFSTKRLAARD